MASIVALVFVFSFSLIGVVMFSNAKQQLRDNDRRSYKLTFPSDLAQAQVESWLRSMSAVAPTGVRRVSGVDSIVFETLADTRGISHYLHIPSLQSEYVIAQLRAAVPSIDYELLKAAPNPWYFDYGVEVGMNYPDRPLVIKSAKDFAGRLLASMVGIGKGERVLVQLVVSPTPRLKRPVAEQQLTSTSASMLRVLVGANQATRDEKAFRSQKLDDQNYAVSIRVATAAKGLPRAKGLAGNVITALKAENIGPAAFGARKVPVEKLNRAINMRGTPRRATAQLMVSELVALIGYPIDLPYVPGLDRRSTRHLPAPESVPREGRVIGTSTMPGNERPIAMDYRAAVQHAYVSGSTTTGKTTVLVNLLAQDFANGCGAIVIEYDGNLIERGLRQVPPHRAQDVVVVDFKNKDRHLGLNLLEIEEPGSVASRLVSIFEKVYSDSGRSVMLRKYINYAVRAMGDTPGLTVGDLVPYLNPSTPRETAWAKSVDSNIKDSEIKSFMDAWRSQASKKSGDAIREIAPLLNRMWEFMLPVQTRYMLSQSKSTFNPTEIIEKNKLLFVNLAGVDAQVAEITGTLLLGVMWDAAKRSHPEKPNFLVADEFQMFSHLNDEFIDMLATARKRNLGLVLATQYIDRLERKMQDAIGTNCRTKLVFQSGPGASQVHVRDFADPSIKAEHIQNLATYHAIGRVVTDAGVSAPLTLKTIPDPRGHSDGAEALALSLSRYSRTSEEVEQEIKARRVAPDGPKFEEPDVGFAPLGE
ncbi:TraM recognition domain-containing protein [Dietzia sp. MNB45]|uniref:TraM recognition domain-containing protein n=1 Tax=Dietzia sp. MNB45 TaxID=3238800 RepID=UPI003F7E2D76